MSLEEKPKVKASRKYPIAKPAEKPFRTRDTVDDEQADLVEDLLSPPSIRGFAFSIAGHALLLLILAFWYFSPPARPAKEFDTRMAGSEFGDPSSDQLTGGLGMDTPLAMPDLPDAPMMSETKLVTITSLPASEIQPTLSASNKPTVVGASNGGGVNLTNPGQGGNGDGFGVARFGNGGENINGVEVKVGDPQFTLIWDSRADIDLHVIEPGGSEIYWENKNGGGGGELDVDDVDGFGPENVNYGQGRGAPGAYRWFVHYYGGLGGLAQKTRWKVRIKHAGKITVKEGVLTSIGQKSEPQVLKVASDPSMRETAPVTDATPPPAGAAETARAPVRGNLSPPPPSRPGPRRIAPPGSGFVQIFPDEPRQRREDIKTPLGDIVADTFNLIRTEGSYTLVSLEFPAASMTKTTPDELLDGMVEQTLQDGKGIAVNKTPTTQNGAPARDFTFTLPESIVAGGGRGRSRIVLKGKKAYVLHVIGTPRFVSSPDVESFFRDFELVPAG